MFWQPHQGPRLTGPQFFPITWAQSQELLASPRTDPVEQRFGPPCLPLHPSLTQPLAAEDSQVDENSGLPIAMHLKLVCVESTPSPRTPLRASEHAKPWQGGASRPRGLTRASLWAATRKQRMAAKERAPGTRMPSSGKVGAPRHTTPPRKMRSWPPHLRPHLCSASQAVS